MINQSDFSLDRNPMAEYYKDFHVEDRILLTGHSHQAWPDCALNGMIEYWRDAANLVDDKWEICFQKADKVREGFSRLLDCESNQIVLASNTHELLIRLLSSFDFKTKKKIITSNAEFHTVRRQLDKLSEIGLIELIKVDFEDFDSIAENILELIDDETALVVISKVFFLNARIMENFDIIQKKCELYNVKLLVDVYHALNAIPFSIKNEGLENAYIIGGGYKYCQLGEGNCFLRIPENCDLFPTITGWYSEFTALAEKSDRGKVNYGTNHWRFAGATYDPISHYRAVEVFNFFDKFDLNINLLRQINRMQIDLLANEFDNLNLNPNIISRNRSYSLEKTAAFLVLNTNFAGKIADELKTHGILTDYRGNNLRLGPAFYLSNKQLISAIQSLGEIVLEKVSIQ